MTRKVLAELGCGTGRGAVRDERTNELVWFDIRRVVLVGTIACARLEVLGIEDELRCVRLPGSRSVWVAENHVKAA